jgi:AraC family transcriptional regulator
LKIEEKNVEKKTVAIIKVKGPYELLPQTIGEVVGWVMNNGLTITEPPFGIYYNSPQEVPPEELEFEIGIPIEGKGQDEGRVKIRDIPPHIVLSTIHQGAYNEVGPIYQKIMEYAEENGFQIVGAPVEIYRNNPMEVASDEELITEIQFPVLKK